MSVTPSRRLAGLLVVGGCLAPAVPARAQIYASERATLKQVIAGTEITIDYSRPSVRGRDSIFGREVTWDEVWTPGANQSTTLHVSKPVRLNGLEVQAGTYSMWMQARPDSGWMLYLNPDTTLFHIPHPSLDGMVYTIPVVRQVTSPIRETMSWDFERIRATGAELQLRWADVVVPLEVKVEPGIETHVAAEVGRRFAGAWTLTPEVTDTTTPEEDRTPTTVQVRYDDDAEQLIGVMEDPTGAGDWEFLLIPRAEGIFLMGTLMDGDLAEVSFDWFLEFTFDGDRPVSFVGRDKDDAVFWRGVRAESGAR